MVSGSESPVADQADEYRRLITERLAERDWHGAYRWAKGWIGSGGGERLLDPWLTYVASSLIQGHPRSAVHSVDLALQLWIEPQPDRAILHWVRSRVIRFSLADPKTASSDLDVAAGAVPLWLRPQVETDIPACAEEAARSRKRKAVVGPTPEFTGTSADARPLESRPELWPVILPFLPCGPPIAIELGR